MQHFQLDNHVPEQLSLGGVRNGPLIAELVEFADVVKKRAGQQQVAIHLGIVTRRQIADREQRHHVIEQAPDKRVMQGLGRGSILVRSHQRFIRHELME